MNPIVAEVERRGRLTFRDFMELALYHPEAGYYTRPRSGAGPVGATGDFITAPSATPLFGRTAARLIGRLHAELGEPLTLVELGAGEGFFLSTVTGELTGGELGRVVAVELADWARARLQERCPQAEVSHRLASFPHAQGPTVLFASELYDALPVHRVTVRRHAGTLALAEFYVVAGQSGRLHWEVGELSDPGLENHLAARNVTLEEGQIAEIRPALERHHAEHLAWCGRNAVAIVVEYGYPARQLYNAKARRLGSLTGYRGHAHVDDVLSDPGQIDLTAHVDFDDLMNSAADLGWERGVPRPLGVFLALHGITDLLPTAVKAGEELSAEDWAELAAVKRLLHPAGMGGDLKVLVQGKGPAWAAYRRVATPPPAEA
ncbi:MAG: SAM-dependent methyltransferase [Acidobacteriota bacterium]